MSAPGAMMEGCHVRQPRYSPGARSGLPARFALESALYRATASVLPLELALERADGAVSVYRTAIHVGHEDTPRYVERLLKFLLWQKVRLAHHGHRR